MIVASHLGRPKGAPDPQFSLAPVAARLGELLGADGVDVAFAADTVGDSARATVDGAGRRRRSRCWRTSASTPGETAKDDAERGAFADRLAALADIYVGDGFGAVHRKHASVYDLPARLPHAAGGLIATEVGVLKKLTEDVARPYAVVLGGSKVSDKLGVIDHLLEQGRPHPGRRRHGLHLPQGPGPRGRQEPAAGGPDPGRHRVPGARPRPRAWSSCCRSTWSAPPSSPT